jgi:transposase-like protein
MHSRAFAHGWDCHQTPLALARMDASICGYQIWCMSKDLQMMAHSCLSYYALSYHALEEMMQERGLHVDHTTIFRLVQHYAPELEKRRRPYLKITTDSWRVDEAYVKVKGTRMYLYRAIDSERNTLEFLLSMTRDAEAAKRFFQKGLNASTRLYPA